MKLAAIMMVRNEAPILADSIGHLLHNIGVDRIYLADNGSTDATPAILHRLAALDGRVRLRSVPGAFRQPEVLNGLLAEAMADGADWLLPNDADEFLDLDGGALRARCAAAAGIGGFQFDICNFAQLRWVRRDRPGSIETMLFRAIPVVGHAEARVRVTQDGLPFIRGGYPPKLLLRAAPGLYLHRGQHYAEGLNGPLEAAPIADLLHAPIRSRSDLAERVAHGERVLEATSDPETSWHLKRLVGMDEAALDAEWRANSVGVGWRVGWPPPGFRLDLRLARLGRRLQAFRRRVIDRAAKPRTGPSGRSASSAPRA